MINCGSRNCPLPIRSLGNATLYSGVCHSDSSDPRHESFHKKSIHVFMHKYWLTSLSVVSTIIIYIVNDSSADAAQTGTDHLIISSSRSD